MPDMLKSAGMKIKKNIYELRKNAQELGLERAVVWRLEKIFAKERYDRNVLNWLYAENIDIINKYRDLAPRPITPEKNIWVLWWQGKEEMPELVQACYQSVTEHCGEFNVILLHKDNISDYVELPDYILRQFETGSISVTHLSDIIRVNLLKTRGGIWMDATLLLTDDIDKIHAGNAFFTGRTEYTSRYVSRGRWTVFFWCCMHSEGSLLFSLLADIFENYWRNHRCLTEYFLLDYAVCLCYDNLPWAKESLDSISSDEMRLYDLSKALNTAYSAPLYDEITKRSKIHKLSYKTDARQTTKKGEMTNYGYILQHYGIH